jgi:hypothetical protein
MRYILIAKDSAAGVLDIIYHNSKLSEAKESEEYNKKKERENS